MPVDIEKVAERLTEEREKLRYNQAGVAAIADVSQRTFSSWENGVLPGQWKSLVALAKKFGTSADYLLGLTDDPRPKSTTAPHKITDEQAALLELFEQLDEEERHYVMGLLTFVKSRNTPRIIGSEE